MQTTTRRLAGERGGSPPICVLLVCGLAFGCVTTPFEDGAAPVLERAHAKRDLGLDYLSRGNTSMAIRELQQALELDPDNAEILLWLGEGYRRKQRLGEAQVFMERALALSPKSHLVRLNLSGLYIQLERYDDAIALANTLVGDVTYLSPWQALNNRGWAQLQNDQPEAAEASFREALDFHPRFWPATLNLGILASRQGQKRAAVEHFNQVLEREPDAFALSETNFRIGEVYVSWGHRRKAIGYFEAALSDSPNSRWGEQSPGYLALLE